MVLERGPGFHIKTGPITIKNGEHLIKREKSLNSIVSDCKKYIKFPKQDQLHLAISQKVTKLNVHPALSVNL